MGAGKERVPFRLAVAGALAAVIPDLDVAGLFAGIPYDHELGHRGASHSLAFAVLLGLGASALSDRMQAGRWTYFLFVFASVASHGFADMLTNGGRGVGLLWPFDATRLFFPWRPIEVSPIGARFFGDSGLTVLASEFIWLIAPLGVLATLIVARRRSLH